MKMDPTWIDLIFSRSPLGRSTRTLLAAAVFAPLLLGILIFYGQNSGWFGPGLAGALYVGAIMLLLSIIVLSNASRLSASERDQARLQTDFRSVQQQMLALLENSPMAIFIKDAHGLYRLVNSHFEEIVGRSREQLIGRDGSSLFAPDVAEAIALTNAKILDTKKTVISEISLNVAGQPRTYLNTNFPLFNPAGEVESIAGIWTNISEQKELNDALRESEERFSKVFQLSPVGVTLTRVSDGHFIDVNSAASNIFGLAREEIIGKTSLELGILSPEAREKITAEIRAAGLVRNIELPIESKSMGTRQLLYSVEKVNIGKEPSFLAVMIDITERKKAEELLQKSNADLERSNKELEQFAYVASHDLQEPLRMVSSYMQLLESRYREKLDTDAQEFIDFAVDGAVRMQHLIQDLLAFSRVGTRGKPPEAIDGNSVLQEALGNLRLRIEETQANIRADQLPVVMADRNQFMQVFQNLIGNAIKFSGKNPPRITVTVEESDGFAEFAVADKGIGFDPKHSDRIFVIFQRLNNRTEYEGTGIGLAICKKIVERHGGRIWVETQVDKGSTFHFSFPLAPAQAVAPTMIAAPTSAKKESESIEERAGRLI